MSGPGRVVLVTRAGSQANRWSIELVERVRALVRVTGPELPIPASEMYAVLGHLESVGYGLAQGLRQLAVCLDQSTGAGLFWAAHETTQDTTPDPEIWLPAAVKTLDVAAQAAVCLGTLLADAREEIAQEACEVELRLLQRPGGTTGRHDPFDDLTEPVPDEEPVSAVDPLSVGEGEWLTVEEAAIGVGLSVNTLPNLAWRRRYDGPTGHTVDGRLQFRRVDLIAFRDRRRAA